MREVKFKGSRDNPIAVSYTHLDVYKRQDLYHEHYHDINDIAWVSRHLEGPGSRSRRHRRRYRPKNLRKYGFNQPRQGRKPGRDWTKYVDKEMIPANQPVDYRSIYLKIKEKGGKRTEQINLADKITDVYKRQI